MTAIKLPFALRLALMFGLKPDYEVREHQGSTKQTDGKLIARSDSFDDARAIYIRRRTAGAAVDLRLVSKLAVNIGDPDKLPTRRERTSKGPELPQAAAAVAVPTPPTSE